MESSHADSFGGIWVLGFDSCFLFGGKIPRFVKRVGPRAPLMELFDIFLKFCNNEI